MSRRILAGVGFWLAILGTTASTQAPSADQEWRAGSSVPLLEDPADRWSAERVEVSFTGSIQVGPDTPPPIIAGVLHLSPRAGWTRLAAVHRHFRLEFEYRGADDPSFDLFFRTWRRLNKTGAPVNAYAMTLRPQDAGWHSALLDCRGTRAELSVDGTLVATNEAIGNPAGYVGFRAESGQIEIRNLLLTPFTRQRAVLAGLRAGEDKNVQLPRVRHEMKPRYTEAAMRQQIQGAVLLEALVDEAGSVSEVAILESLDPTYGLDEEAEAATRRWRFDPATRAGMPVPVVVTIEMQFTLK